MLLVVLAYGMFFFFFNKARVQEFWPVAIWIRKELEEQNRAPNQTRPLLEEKQIWFILTSFLDFLFKKTSRESHFFKVKPVS